jgi:hypothetical protein
LIKKMPLKPKQPSAACDREGFGSVCQFSAWPPPAFWNPSFSQKAGHAAIFLTATLIENPNH